MNLAIATCVVLAFCSTSGAEEPTLIHSESGGFITLEGESRIRVSGIKGTIAVRTGQEGELRYEVRTLDKRREERPVGLWLDGRSFEIAPLEAAAEERLLLEMTVSPGLSVELDLDDSNVQIAGLRSDLFLVGAGLDVDARGIVGKLTVEVVESDMKLDGVSGDVEIDGEAIGLLASRIQGVLVLTLLDSEADIRSVSDLAEIDLENTVLLLSSVEAGLILQANGGRVDVEGVKPRSEFRLDDTPLILTKTVGEATIETNSEVQVGETRGPVVISGYGGPIIGKTLESTVAITVDQATIELEDVRGKLTINGNDLSIALKNLTGEAVIRTESSKIRAEGVGAPLLIENAFGPVEIQGAKADVRVVNRDGDVVLTELAGSVSVFGSGQTVEVGWSEFPAEGQHMVTNEQGGIVVKLPARARCRIEAQSKYGRISSDIPTVRINDDEKFASGVIGGGRGPTIQIRSHGDVLISGDAARAAEDLPTQ